MLRTCAIIAIVSALATPALAAEFSQGQCVSGANEYAKENGIPGGLTAKEFKEIVKERCRESKEEQKKDKTKPGDVPA